MKFLEIEYTLEYVNGKQNKHKIKHEKMWSKREREGETIPKRKMWTYCGNTNSNIII